MKPPTRDSRPKPKADYDERIYRKGHPPHRMRNALILIVLVLIGTYLAVDQGAPVPEPSTSCNAVFDNAANIRKDSPVRIAGVNVGEVKSVEQRRRRRRGHLHRQGRRPADPRGRPGRDPPAHLPRGQLLPRRQAGQPERPRARRRRHDPGHPDLDRGPARPDPDLAPGARPREPRRSCSQGYGTALNHKPTAAEDEGQDPDVQGETAGRGDQRVLRLRRRRRPRQAIVERGPAGHRAARPLAS